MISLHSLCSQMKVAVPKKTKKTPNGLVLPLIPLERPPAKELEKMTMWPWSWRQFQGVPPAQSAVSMSPWFAVVLQKNGWSLFWTWREFLMTRTLPVGHASLLWRGSFKLEKVWHILKKGRNLCWDRWRREWDYPWGDPRELWIGLASSHNDCLPQEVPSYPEELQEEDHEEAQGYEDQRLLCEVCRDKQYLEEFPPLKKKQQVLPEDVILEYLEFAILYSWQKQILQ